MKQKLTIAEQIGHMKNNGVQFNIIDETAAEKFISDNTYYFKIKSYAKNYPKNKDGKYINLEFAALKELSTLDMHLRRLVLITTLNIEHAINTNINRHFSQNIHEDGYSIVKAFRGTCGYTDVRKNNYTEKLIDKYDPDYAIWNYLEVISFGTLIDFYKHYYDIYDVKQKKIYPILYSIKMLRNISAHNNCVLNNLVLKNKKVDKNDRKEHDKGDRIKSSYFLKSYIAQEGAFSENQLNKLSVPVIHDFASMLYAVNYFNHSSGLIDYTYRELDSFVQRIERHIDYFDKHLNIKNNLLFFGKLVDYFKQKAYNN